VDDLLDFIGEIYEASLAPERWDAVIARLCRMIDARSGGINVEDHALGQRYMIATYGMPAFAKLSYRLGMSKHDHIFKIQASRPVGEAALVANHQTMKEDYPLYYRFIMKPFNMGYVAAIGLFNDEQWHAGIGVHRAFDDEPFGDRELRLLDRMAPHFQRALRIQREFYLLKNQNESLSGALGRLITGVIVLDRARGVVYRNDATDAILRKHPALSLKDDRLRAYFAGEQKMLTQLIEQLMDIDPREVTSRNQAMALRHPQREHPLMLMLAPVEHSGLPGYEHSRAGNVAIFLSDPESTFSMPAESLNRLYGLTPAEANVAIQLANGLSPKDIAENNGVGNETVRSQLKSIFSKLGVQKQQDVIRLLLSQSPGLVSSP
jgi:DNA-binding CsgD family transcriptional regulator